MTADESTAGGSVPDGSWSGGRVAERLPDVGPPWAWVIGLSLAAFVLAMGLLIGVIVVFFLVAAVASAATTDPVSTARSLGQLIGVAMLVGYLTWLPIVGAVVWYFDLPLLGRPDATGILQAIASFVVLAGLAVVIYLVLPHEVPAMGGGESVPDPGPLVLLGVFAALVVGGIVEELLFRGTIQGLLRDQFAAPAAIIGANVLFVPLHLINNLGQPLVTMAANVTVITLLGLVAGYLFERHRSVVVPAAVHGAYNAVVVTAGYLL